MSTPAARRPSVLVRQRQPPPPPPPQPTTPVSGTPTDAKTASGFRRRLSRLESLVLPQTGRQTGRALLQKSQSEVKCMSATAGTFAEAGANNGEVPGLLRKSSGGLLRRRFRSASTTLAAFTGMVRRHSETPDPSSRPTMRQSAKDLSSQAKHHDGGPGTRTPQEPRVSRPLRSKIVACDVSENGSPARRGNVPMGLLPTSAAGSRKPSLTSSLSRVGGRQASDIAVSTFQPTARDKENTEMVGGTPRGRDKRATLQRKNRSMEAGAEKHRGARQVSAFPVNTLGDEAVEESAPLWQKPEEAVYENAPLRQRPEEAVYGDAPVWQRPGEAAKERAQTFADARRFNAPALQISTGASTQEAADMLDAARQRSATVQPSPLSGRMSRYRGANYVLPDPSMAQEELTGMLERLIQTVQDKRREVTALPAFTSPRTPTRFDLGGENDAARGRSPSSASAGTVETVQLSGSDSGPEAEAEAGAEAEAEHVEAYSPRRRAVTVGPAGGSRGAREVRRRLSGEVGGAAGARAYSSSVSEVRRKIEKVRARRAAQLARQAEQAAEEPGDGPPEALSPAGSGAGRAGWQPLARPRLATGLSGSTVVDGEGAAAGFFESRGARAMFQELALAVKDVEWDKRVYYYHEAQADGPLRRLAELAQIRDCRDECLVDLLGPRAAEHLLRRQQQQQQGADAEEAEAGYLAGSDVDAVAEWMDAASDWSAGEGEDEGARRSFDWSRDGFGYMEFRRLSKASLTAVVSPGMEPRQPPQLLGPLASPMHARPADDAVRSPQPERFDALASFAVPSLAADGGGSARALRPLRGALDMRRRRPATMFDLGRQGLAGAGGLGTGAGAGAGGALARISESEDVEEEAWRMVVLEEGGGGGGGALAAEGVGRRGARERLSALRRENDVLRGDLARVESAVRSLQRLYRRNLAVARRPTGDCCA
ncbi:hypothetical protein LPJ53_000020 [Coemansia erecta]|uniref:Uncharacterized protein n=1 Tax=Coemansia erecta TaxID=147472 RepID=A0A9W7Y2L6_9FUNG|nr:hypothetical protein LPJ53_000020 [Coemansia erecta]